MQNPGGLFCHNRPLGNNTGAPRRAVSDAMGQRQAVAPTGKAGAMARCVIAATPKVGSERA